MDWATIPLWKYHSYHRTLSNLYPYAFTFRRCSDTDPEGLSESSIKTYFHDLGAHFLHSHYGLSHMRFSVKEKKAAAMARMKFHGS